MKRFAWVGLSALLAAALLAPIASAATISDVIKAQFDPTSAYYGNYGLGQDNAYGQGACLLSWSSYLGDGRFDPSGHLTGNYAPPSGVSNPAWLNFNAVSNNTTPVGGGGGGGGGGGSSSATQYDHTYSLGSNTGKDWAMVFHVLIYDPTYAGEGMQVSLLGTAEGSTLKAATLTAAEVKSGELLTWDIQAVAGETVAVTTSSVGQDDYAAGYFMEVAPEPATMAFLIFGVGAALIRRKGRK
jgi:hypothetical protein